MEFLDVEVNFIAGRHKCGRRMAFRIDESKDKESGEKLFMIYGLCKKCKVIVVSGCWFGEKPPIPDVDYIMEWDKIAEESNDRIKA